MDRILRVQFPALDSDDLNDPDCPAYIGQPDFPLPVEVCDSDNLGALLRDAPEDFKKKYIRHVLTT